MQAFTPAQMREYGQLCRQQLLDTIVQQRKLLERALSALNYHTAQTRPIHETQCAVVEITSHLRQQEGESE